MRVKNELEKCFDSVKSKNEDLRLELENKDKVLNECMNENVALKLSIDDKLKHCDHKHENRQFRNKHAHTTCYSYGRKRNISYFCSFKKNISFIKKVWVPKGSHVLTNHKGPIKVWVPKSLT